MRLHLKEEMLEHLARKRRGGVGAFHPFGVPLHGKKEWFSRWFFPFECFDRAVGGAGGDSQFRRNSATA